MRVSVRFLVIILAIVFAGRTIWSQTATGTILGHITDSSGAAVPDVAVVAFNPENPDPWHNDAAPGRWNAQKLAFVRAEICHPQHKFISGQNAVVGFLP